MDGATPPPESAILAVIARIATVRAGVTLGVGDDAAVLDGDPPVVVTQDLLVDGVHFRRATATLADIGHKALAVNLSDLAAMGATPVAAFVGLGLPDTDPLGADDVAELFGAMDALAALHGVTIAGGDLVTAPALLLAVTATGALPAGAAPVRRSGARPGDVVCLTGAAGAAAAGLAILERPALAAATPHAAELTDASRRPVPRIVEGRHLAAAGATAMMDASDGLALDADRLGRASGVGVEIDLGAVPRAAGVDAVARALEAEPDLFAVTGGEDFELIATLPPDRVAGAVRTVAGLTIVGRVTAGPPGVVLVRDGRPVPVAAPLGWEHRPGARS